MPQIFTIENDHHHRRPAIQNQTQTTASGWTQPNQDPNFLSSNHYKEWERNLKNSVGKRETIIKFLYQLFFVYGVETISLGFTFFLGFGPDGISLETLFGIGFYLVTCLVCVCLNQQNKVAGTSLGSRSTYTWKTFLLNCVFLLKPVRYAKVFRIRRTKINVIRTESVDGRITGKALGALVDIYEEELQDKMVERNEAFFQSIPMAFIQLYFLFANHESFMLCSKDDVSRVLTIIFSVYHAAQAVTNYDIASYEYQGSIHFLSFFESGGAHPKIVYPGGLINSSNFTMLVGNFFTMFAVFYVSAFFLNAAWYLCLLFLTIIFLLNIILLFLFPQLEDIFCNAPLGVHTSISYFVQRVINIFSGSGTKFPKMTQSQFGIGKLKCRFPLVFVQVAVFGAAIFVTSKVAGLNRNHSDVLLKSLSEKFIAHREIEDVIDKCTDASEMNLKGWYFYSKWTRMIGDYLFPVYEKAQNQFQEVNDLFNLVHFNWLLMYLGLLSTWVFAFSDLRRRMKDPRKLREGESTHFKEVYPIITGCRLYKNIIGNVLNENSMDTEKLEKLRKLMILTIIAFAPNNEFQKLVRIFYIFPKYWLGKKTLNKEIEKNAVGIEWEVDVSIQNCWESNTNHPLLPEFKIMYNFVRANLENKILFLKFLKNFDKSMSRMSSHKIETVVRLAGAGQTETAC